MSQRDLAEKLEKKESEVSKWLSPGHNFTLKTIARLETALGSPVLNVAAPELEYRSIQNEPFF